jgi:hypothetical protein
MTLRAVVLNVRIAVVQAYIAFLRWIEARLREMGN